MTPGDFVPFVLGQYGEYLDNMSLHGTWGDHTILQALCVRYSALVQVLKVENGTMTWMEVGDRDNHDSAFFLHLQDNHYENLLVASQTSH